MAQARWWELRPARNLQPKTYRCPLCGELLPALRDHVLLAPEGRAAGRRHAHTHCVLEARRAGRLPTREEWDATATATPTTTTTTPAAADRDREPRRGWLARWRRSR